MADENLNTMGLPPADQEPCPACGSYALGPTIRDLRAERDALVVALRGLMDAVKVEVLADAHEEDWPLMEAAYMDALAALHPHPEET